MQTLEVFDPAGATEITQLHAARLGSLEGKTVALLSNDMWQAHRMLPMLKEILEARYEGITVIPETEFPMGECPDRPGRDRGYARQTGRGRGHHRERFLRRLRDSMRPCRRSY